ncbi:hypothetical protein [Salmonella enterica]|uniref:hypothetical protein n=1 Tax=Salmonella enterica TaxID=28901 RepID=UPI001CB72408|nr:hypothetical protein [Salmonella enterica]
MQGHNNGIQQVSERSPRRTLSVEEGSIPDEELEVRKQLAALKLCEERLRKCGFFWRLFNSEEYKGYLHITKTVNDNLMNLVNRTPQHKAAIRRIVNSMPENNGGREFLNPRA